MPDMDADCVFCDIVAGRAPAIIVHNWGLALAVVPLNPITAGHLILIPKTHVRNYTERPAVSAMLMHRAAEVAPVPSNLITSAGSAATQTVFHLHLHIVPRREGDGLALPWDSDHVDPNASTMTDEVES